MTFALERVCAQIFDEPLLYDPRKAETMIRALGPRLTGHAVSIEGGPGPVEHVAFANGRPSAGIIGDSLGRYYDRRGFSTFDMIDGVAVIAIEGTLVHKGEWLGASSGKTSYQGLQTQLARAYKQSNVKGVVLEIDSFGGQVNGAFETAAMIRELSRAKPTVAILTDHAYSAGYLLASQARQIVLPETGGAGSIGVVMMHADFSGALEQEGIKVTFIHSGAQKVAGNPYEPLPADLKERWQADVDQLRDRFAATVGAARGKRFSKAAALKTEAAAFNARAALELGLVDAIGDGITAFAAFVKEVNRSN